MKKTYVHSGLLMVVCGLVTAAVGQAEVRGVPVSQLRRVSDTPVVDSGDGQTMPTAVPYGSIAMPPLPQPVSRTTRTPRVAPPPVADTPMMLTSTTIIQTSQTVVVSETKPLPRINADSCRASLKLTAEMAMMAYEQYPRRAYMNLIAAASIADDAARAGGIPNMAAFDAAADDLPWLGPHRAQLRQGTNAVFLTCTPMSGVPEKP